MCSRWFPSFDFIRVDPNALRIVPLQPNTSSFCSSPGETPRINTGTIRAIVRVQSRKSMEIRLDENECQV